MWYRDTDSRKLAPKLRQLEKDNVADRDTTESPSVILKFRYPPNRADILQLIADVETEGNLSELLRDLADQKIEGRLRRKDRVA